MALKNTSIINMIEVIIFILNLACGIYLCTKIKYDQNIMEISDGDIFILFTAYLFIISMKSLISTLIISKELNDSNSDPNNINEEENESRCNRCCQKKYVYVRLILYYMYNYIIAIPIYNVTNYVYKSDLDDLKETNEVVLEIYNFFGICMIIVSIVTTLALIGKSNNGYVGIGFVMSLILYINFIIILMVQYVHKHFEIEFLFPTSFDTYDQYVFLIQIILTFIVGLFSVYTHYYPLPSYENIQ